MVRALCLLALGLAGACGGSADDGPHGYALDAAQPGDGGAQAGRDLAGGGGDAGASGGLDGGAAGPVHTIKLSTSLYCAKMGGITPQLFFASDAALTSTYDAWLAAKKASGASYAAPPLDVLGARVRPGEQGGGSTLTPQQLENLAISCVHLNALAGPGAFETTTLVPDAGGKPACLLTGLDWGIDFHYAGASFSMRGVCLGAPTGFTFSKNFDNDALPTALAPIAGGVGAYAVGDKTYLFGYSTGIWAWDSDTPVGQRASKTTTYHTTLTASNGTGTSTPVQHDYRFVHIGDVVGGGSGGIKRHPMDSGCRIKSGGAQLAYPSGDRWAIRVMLAANQDGSPNQFQIILWADTEFAIGQSVQTYAVVSDLPCEFDQIVDGCFSDVNVPLLYPGSPQFVNDLSAAKALGKRYCGMRPGQGYYLNVRGRGWLAPTPADSCPVGTTCTFGAFLN